MSGRRRLAGALPALLLSTALATAMGTPALAAAPLVSGVSFQQRADGSGLVDVHYDVADADGDTLTIDLQVQFEGGEGWTFPCRTLGGDVGGGVLPGAGKHIVWDAGTDATGREGRFRVRVLASDAGISFRPYSPRTYAIIDWGRKDYTDPSLIQRFARADLVVLDAHSVWSALNEAGRIVEKIKQVNPSCRVIGYVPVMHAYRSWSYPTAVGFPRTFWERTRDHLAYTTTGDTASNWPNTFMLNLLAPGYREALIRTVAEYQRSSVNKLDGIFWDYFPHTLWIAPGVLNEGDPDLDGDGIGHWSDSDEVQAFRLAQVSLVTAFRDSLGDGFLQIFNGVRAGSDSAFAALADAIHYELFPTIAPYHNDDDDMRQALDPANPVSLWHSRRWPRQPGGLPPIIVSNIWRNTYIDTEGRPTTLSNGNLFRAVSLLVDCAPVWCEEFRYSESWPSNPITLGRPLGPAVILGDSFTREFEYGRIELVMTSGRYPVALRYRIWENGRIVEELAIPYHFP